MALQMPQLKRGLFGYRAKTVRLILAGRDIMYRKLWQRLGRTESELARARAAVEAHRQESQRHAERARVAEEERLRQSEQTKAAEDRATELQEEIATLRARIQRLEEQAAAHLTDPNGAGGSAPDDLSTILESAERAFARITERARQRNEGHLRAIEAAREELRAETGRLTAWRAAVHSLLGSVRDAVAHARAQIHEAPQRLREALTPTTDAMVSVNDTLAKLDGATERLPVADETRGDVGFGVSVTVRVPEASNGSNGAVDPEDLAPIQEQYSSP